MRPLRSSYYTNGRTHCLATKMREDTKDISPEKQKSDLPIIERVVKKLVAYGEEEDINLSG